jgi:hypothetical protein
MQYLDEFDEDSINETDFIDKWIQENNADITNIKAVSFSKVKQTLKEDYANESE